MARWFQYQNKVDPVPQPPEVMEDSWHQPWSEPVRQKIAPSLAIALIASGLIHVPIPPTGSNVGAVLSTVSVGVQYERRHQYQGIASTQFVAETITPDKWLYPWSEPVRHKLGLASHLQQAIALQGPVEDRPIGAVSTYLEGPPSSLKLLQYQSAAFPTPIVETTAVDKWFSQLSEPVRQRVFSPSEQDVSADVYFITIEIVTEDKWHYPLSEPVRTRNLATALQPSFFAPPTTPAAVVANVTIPSTISVGVQYENRHQYQSSAYSPFFVSEVIYEDKWHFSWSEPVRQKPGLQAHLQQASIQTVLNPETQITQDYESRWHQPWSEPVRIRRLATAQQPSAVLGLPSFEVIYYDKWGFQWSEPVRQKHGLGTRFQQTLAWGYTTPEPTSPDKWFAPWADPPKPKTSIRLGSQQFFGTDTDPIVSFSWFANLSEPVRSRKLSTAQQQFYVSGLIPDPSTLLQGYFPWSEPVRQKPGLGAGFQQTLAWGYTTPAVVERIPSTVSIAVQYENHHQYQAFANPVFTPAAEVIYEDKWHYPWSEPVRKKSGLAVRYQQPLVLAPTPPIVSFSYYNWLAEPVRLKKGLRADKQQFLAYSFSKPIVSFGYYGWLSDPVRLKKGLRADEQQAFIGPSVYPNLPTAAPWFAPLSEPVRPKKGLWARLQQFFTTDPLPYQNAVFVTLDATETNNDTAFFAALVYNRPVRANVSIKEIPRADDAYASIEET